MRYEKKYDVIFASIILGALSVFLIVALVPFRNAIFGAIILHVLFLPFYKWMTGRLKWKKGISAILVILATLFIILIPLFSLLGLLVGEVATVLDHKDALVEKVERIDALFPTLDFATIVKDQIAQIGDWLSKALVSTIQGASNLVLSLTIMYFILFYMLVNDEVLGKKIARFIPFNKKNSAKLIEEFKSVTYATVVTTGVIAVIQGVLMTVGFLVFGIPGAFLWGFFAAVLSFLPVVGPTIVWLPAAGFLLFSGRYGAAIGLTIWGFVLSNVDNFIRPHLQKTMGNLHPLISLIGIFVGLPYFGILGIIVGPLLLNYFVLLTQMFKEEYIE